MPEVVLGLVLCGVVYFAYTFKNIGKMLAIFNQLFLKELARSNYYGQLNRAYSVYLVYQSK